MSKLYDLLSAMCGKIKKPDWNQNDPTAPDYVKNRPFYTGDPVETVLVEESTVSFQDVGGGLYISDFPSAFEATSGETYTVFWDGAAYECACVDFRGRLVIGNLSVFGSGPDTGEPFVINVYNGVRITIATEDTSSSHTISISSTVAQIVKIPAKFIDKDAFGYIVVHNSSTMTEEEAENHSDAISNGEAVFIIWGSLCLRRIAVSTVTDSTGVSVRYLSATTLNGENYSVAKNSEGLFKLNDRVLTGAEFPYFKGSGEKTPTIRLKNKQFSIASGSISIGVGTTDILFSVSTNGTKSKDFNVLGNGEAVTPALILYSSTADSTKKFRITVDDSGKPTFTNSSDSADSYTPTDLPTVTASDSGKFLRVSGTGEWVAETISNASGVSF